MYTMGRPRTEASVTVHTPIIITILPGKLPSPVREDVLEMLQNQPGIYIYMYIMSYTELYITVLYTVMTLCEFYTLLL